ncbi:MAG: FAD-binding oxidoreductase [Rhodospirillales bacterium]|nr:FAD-binding oxidoreductase [Rhodospirillales bacterium]
METTSEPFTQPSPHLLKEIRTLVGERGWIEGSEAIEPYLTEERGLFHGTCAAVVRPATVIEAAAVVRLCAEARVPIVPHGGNTGLVGGGVPRGGIVVSTARLNRIRAIDAVNRTMTVEAGAILAEVQAAADAAGALFPLSLGAEGSCRIGGNLATNAGGMNVLRYGNARDLVLGLEVVLADGRIWHGLTGLRKNNTGYDLKQLFLGAEGTLGLITAAVLKLFAKPKTSETALVAVPSVDAAVELFARLNDVAGDALSAFELMARIAIDFCLRHIPGCADPLGEPAPYYVLLKLTSPRRNDPLRETIEDALAEAYEGGIVVDAVVAQNEGQASELWRLRESIPEAQKPEGGSIKNDISVPLSRVAEFIARASHAVEQAMPGIRPVPFGHLGDGNIHFNLSQPIGAERAAFLSAWDRLERIVSDIAAELGGSFSAEHGIGELKRETLLRYKSSEEMELMRKVKAAFDPCGIMNPGKILAP